MNEVILSVLIPTTPDRKADLVKLFKCLSEQDDVIINQLERFKVDGLICERFYDFFKPIEILVFEDDKTMTIGEKRELLYKYARGVYSIHVDSDDLLAPDAIKKILEAIRNNPETHCITFMEKCMMNGEYKISNHSIKYNKWQDNFDGYDYVRCPFYKDVIRTDIAKSVPFPHIRYNEDEQWSMAIKPFLTDEVHIDEELYYYIYNETNTIERYGFDKQ